MKLQGRKGTFYTSDEEDEDDEVTMKGCSVLTWIGNNFPDLEAVEFLECPPELDPFFSSSKLIRNGPATPVALSLPSAVTFFCFLSE
jgi:hypothetical protein